MLRRLLSVTGLLIGAWGFAETLRAEVPPLGTPSKAVGGVNALKSIGRIGDLPAAVPAVAWSPQGELLAIATGPEVRLLSGTEVKSTLTAGKTVRSLAFSPDGAQLAVGMYQKIVLWDVANSKEQRTLKGPRAYVTGLAWSPDGLKLAASSEDEVARVWTLAGEEAPVVLSGHAYPVTGVAWSADGQTVATVAGDDTRLTKPGELKLWDTQTWQARVTATDHKQAALCVAFSPDSKLVASGGLDERVILYNLPSGEPVGFYGGHSRPVNTLAFVPKSSLIVSGSGGGFKGMHEIRLWRSDTGEDLTAEEEAHEAKVNSVAVSADGTKIAAGSQDRSVTLWQLPGSQSSDPVATVASVVSKVLTAVEAQPAPKVLRVGVIGLDTSHAPAFAKLLNDPDAPPELAHCKVVAAYPKGSPDIESSTKRVPEYTKIFQDLGIEIVDSIPALLEKVDCVLLETNDGRPHLEQVLPVLKAGKPCFIDKPIAGSLTDAVAIFEAAKKYKVPVFSASSLRFAEGAQKIRGGSLGDVYGCDAYSPASLEATHPDLFWYGIHGVETLFTVMGPGCESVTRAQTPGTELVTGVWTGGRIGTFRGLRQGSGYGGTAFGSKGIGQIGPYGGYKPLAVEFVKFFRTGTPPVDEQETLEIYAFMEAADESKRQGGVPVKLQTVLDKAKVEAGKRLKELGVE